MMEARRVHGLLDVHPEVDHVQDHLHHRRRNPRAARGADGHEQLAVPDDDRRRHRRERPLARLNRVRLALHEPEHVGRSRLRGEVVHLVVDEESKSRHGDAVAVAAVQRVGDGDCVAVGVDDGVMRRFRLFGAGGSTRADGIARRRARGIDRRAQLREIRAIEQTRNRHLHEIGIADVLVAIGVSAPHRFGRVVNRRRGSGAALLVSRAFEDAEHLEQREAAGARRRRRDDRVVAVLAFERRALDRPVAFEIRQRDDAAVRRHLLGKPPRRVALVEFLRAVGRDPFQRARQFGLSERLADVEERAVLLEDALRLGRCREALRSLERFGERVGNGKSLRRQLDGRRDQLGPLPPSVLGQRELEAAHRAGNA